MIIKIAHVLITIIRVIIIGITTVTMIGILNLSLGICITTVGSNRQPSPVQPETSSSEP